MTRARPIAFLAVAASAAALTVSACGSNNNNDNQATASTAPPKASNGQTATIAVANTDLGKTLVDSQGRTVYLFQKDQGTKSSCTGGCAVAWPPVRDSGKPTVGPGLSASKIGTTPRSDGKPQVTYNGHPLYTFDADKNPGDTSGQGVNAFGALWYVVSPAGNQITSSPSSSSGGGFGY